MYELPPVLLAVTDTELMVTVAVPRSCSEAVKLRRTVSPVLALRKRELTVLSIRTEVRYGAEVSTQQIPCNNANGTRTGRVNAAYRR